MAKVKVWCYLDELEKEEKVLKALKNIFPTIKFETKEKRIEGEGKKEDLNFIKELIWLKKIRNTVNDFLVSKIVGNKTELLINKQAAYAGKLSLVENDSESPFGAIHVVIESKELEDFINEFSPKAEKKNL